MQDFTVCFRFRLDFFQASFNTLFSVSLENGYTDFFKAMVVRPANGSLKRPQLRFVQDLPNERYKKIWTLLDKPLLKWTHACLTVDDTGRMSKLYLNGEFVAGVPDFPSHGLICKGSIMVLGQEQDEFGGGFNHMQSFSGSIAQFNIWNYILDEVAIMSNFNCSYNLEQNGDFLGMDENKWSFSNVEIVTIKDKRYTGCGSLNRSGLKGDFLICKNPFMKEIQYASSIINMSLILKVSI